MDKDQILALWLDTLEMGRGPKGWMTGFFLASEAIYERRPNALTDDEFFRLIAVLIAPRSFDLRNDDHALAERVTRIQSLISLQCVSLGNADVWLEGCR